MVYIHYSSSPYLLSGILRYVKYVIALGLAEQYHYRTVHISSTIVPRVAGVPLSISKLNIACLFVAYGPQLSSRLHLSHTQLNVVGLSGNSAFLDKDIVSALRQYLCSRRIWDGTPVGSTC